MQRRAILFALLAPILILSSYPGVFLFGGIFLALLPALLRERRWFAGLLLAGAIALSFAAFYFITIRAQRSSAMDAAWVNVFPDLRRPWTLPFWAMRSTVSVVDYASRPIGGILVMAAVIGGVRCWREGRRELVIFAAVPMLLAMSAALVRAYPYAGARTMVFAMPGLALLIGSGIAGVAEWRPRPAALRVLILGLLMLPLAATAGFAVYRAAVPWPRAATATAADYVLKHRAPDEPVTANHWEYEYYFRALGSSFAPDLRMLDAPSRAARLWVVITGQDRPKRDALVDAALGRWRIAERHEFERTTVLLLTAKDSDAP